MTDAWKPRNPAPPAMDDAWNIDGKKPKLLPGGGFDNDFAEKLWDSFEPGKDTSKPLAIPSRPNPVGAQSSGNVKPSLPRKGQDAFEGLGLCPLIDCNRRLSAKRRRTIWLLSMGRNLGCRRHLLAKHLDRLARLLRDLHLLHDHPYHPFLNLRLLLLEAGPCSCAKTDTHGRRYHPRIRVSFTRRAGCYFRFPPLPAHRHMRRLNHNYRPRG